MHRSIILLILSGLVLIGPGCKRHCRKFGGHWIWTADLEQAMAEGRQPREAFYLALRQNNKKVTGIHAAMRRYGRDLDVPCELSIEGEVQGNVATVTFYSAIGQETGRARIEFRDDELHWEIVEGDFAHFLPAQAVLHKRSSGLMGTGHGPLLK
jgi:hypothetical protein